MFGKYGVHIFCVQSSADELFNTFFKLLIRFLFVISRIFLKFYSDYKILNQCLMAFLNLNNLIFIEISQQFYKFDKINI